MAEKWQTWLDRQGNGIARLLQDLIRIPTVNPPGENYLRFIAAMRPRLQALGMTTRVVRVPTAVARRRLPGADAYPRASLIGRLDVGARQTVHFNCHYDVVPAAGGWRYGPFEPKVRDGWVYGRGSSDMKGAIAAVCLAVQALRRHAIRPSMNVEVSLTPDEETGGDLGAGYLVREGHVRADYAVICEGGSGRDVGIGHNGVLWLEARIHGKAAHASSPQAGTNAFEKMAALAMRLQPLKERFAQRPFRSPGDKPMFPTLSIGGVFGVGPGAKINTVPALASFSLDRRITPGERLRDAERELRGAIRTAAGEVGRCKVDVSRLLAIDPCHVDPLGRLPQTFARCARTELGTRIGFSLARGFTDMHFFVKEAGIPAVGYGPGGRNYHAVDEAARIQDLLACARVYARFMIEGAGPQRPDHRSASSAVPSGR